MSRFLPALLITLSFATVASGAKLTDPPDFSPKWMTEYDKSCTANNGKNLAYRIFTQQANDGMRKVFVTVDVNGVRAVQMRSLELYGASLGVDIEVQKGDEVLRFEDHQSADGAVGDALGMSKSDFRQCFGR